MMFVLCDDVSHIHQKCPQAQCSYFALINHFQAQRSGEGIKAVKSLFSIQVNHSVSIDSEIHEISAGVDKHRPTL